MPAWVDLRNEVRLTVVGQKPKTIAEIDDYRLSIVRVRGSLGWHTHDDADELLYVLDGRLLVETDSGTDVIEAGQLTVVAKQKPRHPIANPEAVLLLWERRGATRPRTVDPAAE